MKGRIRLSMDKDWSFYLGEIPVQQGNSHGDIYNTSKAGSCQGVPQADFDAREWETVDLPHDWSVRQPFDPEGAPSWGYKTRGKAWYRKSFLLPEEYKDQTLTITFDGVATHATVYFNGSVIGRSYSGYTPFQIDITDRAHFGANPNVIAVFVDADIWEGWWYEGAGIYRHTWLEVKNPVHIPQYGVYVRPEKEEDTGENIWKVHLETMISNTSEKDEDLRLVTTLADPDGKWNLNLENEDLICEPDTETMVENDFILEDPKIWDIEDPQVYRVISRLYRGKELLDRDETVCGFRTIAIDAEKGFFLNGRPVKLFGTCNHQDFGGLGVAVPDSLHEYRIQRLKEMGSNAYRCAHGMPHEELLAACDKLGMLVMDENRNFETSEDGLNQLRTMVLRDRNHPSVIMYSIFNEEPLQGTSEGRRMAKHMRREIHSLDNTRLVTGAMHGGVMAGESAATEVDVCGINYQMGVYDEFHCQYPKIPILGSETTSTFAVRGCYETDPEKNLISCYDEDPADWGNTVRQTWKAVMERDFVAGAFMWTGFDYLGEPTPHVWPSVSSFFGMMDTCGFAKDAFYLAKSIFSKKPVCHVLPHWNHPGREGQIIRVMSHTNCEEAELIVNGVSQGKKAVNLMEQVYWEVPYKPGYIELIGYRSGIKAAHDIKITTKEAKAIRIVPWKKKMFGDGFDAMPVALIAVDEDGREVPTAEFPVEIRIEGGTLLGTCNGDPNCHEDFLSPVRSMFHGRCQAIVRSLEGAEQLSIQVLAKGMETVRTVVPLRKRKRKIPVVESVREQYLADWKIVSKVYTEKPDPQMHIEDFDMNTWQDIRVDTDSGTPKMFENQQGSYGMYRIRVHIPEEINERLPVLHFYGLWGDCEVYINGVKKAFCHHEWPDALDIPIEPEDIGEAEIRVVVQCNNKYGAGIHSMVVIR